MPGFKPGAGEFKGQCCNGVVQTASSCCPLERLSLKDMRCCGPNEYVRDGSCTPFGDRGPSPLPAMKEAPPQVPTPKKDEVPQLDLPHPLKPDYQDAPQRTLPQGQEYA
jgi:hypothetical protein